MRCAGSTDSHRVRIRTCPPEGRGIGASFQRNSSPVNLPAGRAFKIHWRFFLSVIDVLLHLLRLFNPRLLLPFRPTAFYKTTPPHLASLRSLLRTIVWREL